MSPNNADGMANSVDPDQTAPLGGFCLSIVHPSIPLVEFFFKALR